MTTPHDSPKFADHRVEIAGPDDVDMLAYVIAEAFFSLAVSQWLVADPEARRRVFPQYFRILVSHAVTGGLVLTTPARDAAALWLPVGAGRPDGPPAGYREQLVSITGTNLPRFLTLDEEFERTHPRGVPHEHLAILAVRPDRQRLGIGTALLHARHEQLDCDGTPAYLEASDVVKCELYRTHGYVDLGEPLQLPDGPPMFPMWRAPRSTAHANGLRM